MDFGTSYGLALSSGINAYLPLLSFGVAARWLNLYKINPNFSFVTADWFLILMAILALADLFADKIPVVDHAWDAVHTVVRPLAGALVAAASNNQVTGAGIPATMLLGGAFAGMTHVTKATTRVASTATTAGLLNTIISIVEDVVVVIGILLSLFLPIVMTVLIVIFVLLFLFIAPRIVRAIKRRRQRANVGASI